MPESFGQKMRLLLDLPLHKKGSIFWFLFPIILTLSLIVHIVSLNRRKKSYPKINSIKQFHNINLGNIKIICVGNILMGGTGKSPVVQKIASSYLEQGYLVAIASRGVGKNIKPIYFCNKNIVHNIELLSDENREHAEILNMLPNKNNIFYILQNKNRINSLNFLSEEINKNNYHSLKTVFILDDGIQHFACPRDMNICLWSPYLLLNSPNYTMPIGPYREGFGKQSFHHLLNTFDFRFWSRTKESDIKSYKNDIKSALAKYDLPTSKKDILVIYETLYFNLAFNNNKATIGSSINQADLKNILNSCSSISVITGIANPRNLISDLNPVLNGQKINSIFLNDHAQINQKALNLVQKSSTVILTLKDLFRWSQNPIFSDMIKEKNIITCSVKVYFTNMSDEKLDFIPLVNKKFTTA
jgi:tetraacyldisaccharide 4'-kinase